MQEANLGPEHPDVGTSLNSLADLLRKLVRKGYPTSQRCFVIVPLYVIVTEKGIPLSVSSRERLAFLTNQQTHVPFLKGPVWRSRATLAKSPGNTRREAGPGLPCCGCNLQQHRDTAEKTGVQYGLRYVVSFLLPLVFYVPCMYSFSIFQRLLTGGGTGRFRLFSGSSENSLGLLRHPARSKLVQKHGVWKTSEFVRIPLQLVCITAHSPFVPRRLSRGTKPSRISPRVYHKATAAVRAIPSTLLCRR